MDHPLKPLLEAHRGVSSEYPESTFPAFISAVKLGYSMIELDPELTADGQWVIMHDHYINRTGRKPDGTEFKEKTAVSDLPIETLKQLDFGLWKDEEFRGVKVCTLQEIAALSAKTGIRLSYTL